jgi:hypothetical protein
MKSTIISIALLLTCSSLGLAADPILEPTPTPPQEEFVQTPERLCLTANRQGQIIEMKECNPVNLLKTQRLLEDLKKPVAASAN